VRQAFIVGQAQPGRHGQTIYHHCRGQLHAQLYVVSPRRCALLQGFEEVVVPPLLRLSVQAATGLHADRLDFESSIGPVDPFKPAADQQATLLR
jgi:hypothetical protein